MIKRWICGFLAAALVLLLMPVFPVQVKAAANFTVSQQLIDVVKHMEGFSRYPYWDYAQWTVGYGTRCPDDKLDEYNANGIPEEEAEALLQQAMNSYQTSVNDFANRHNLTLQQHQFDALVSFSYNCGTAWMYEMTGYFNQAVRSGDTGSAFLYGICLFSTAGGEYILVNRRLCEANMYINGIYQASNSSDFRVPDNFKYVFLDAGGATVPYNIFAYDANEGLPVPTNFKTVPVGADEEGGLFAYTLQGWVTADGTKLSSMDKTPGNGTVITARWADPDGIVAELPRGDKVNLKVTVTGDWVNVRSGPATYYNKVGTATYGQVLQLTQVVQSGSYTWGKFDQGWLALSYTNYEEVLNQAAFPRNATVTGTDVNVRTGPGTSYSRVGTKTKGDRIVITQEQPGGSYIWGQMTDGNWICMDYVRYDAVKLPTALGIHVLCQPKTTFYQGEALDTTGGVVALRYDDGSATGIPLTSAMVSGYNAAKLGAQTLQVSYNGFTSTYTVNVVPIPKYTVTFQNWDGEVLQTGLYAQGDTVTAPNDPARPEDVRYEYQFAGWDKTVEPVTADAVYTATYHQIPRSYTVIFQDWDGTVLQSDTYAYEEAVIPPEDPTRPDTTQYTYQFIGWDKEVTACTGDAVYVARYEATAVELKYDLTDGVTNSDVIYLLWHTLFPENYPIDQRADFNADGFVDNSDVIYLLWHSLFPESYPI